MAAETWIHDVRGIFGSGLDDDGEMAWGEVAHLGILAAWSLLLCPLFALLIQGVAGSLPPLWPSYPFTISGTAMIIAWISLRQAPWVGAVLAAWIGVFADAAGPGLPGTGAWAYALVPLLLLLGYRRVREDRLVILLTLVGLQAGVQTLGTYVGLRCSGMNLVPVHRAIVSTLLTVAATVGIFAVFSLVLAFVAALVRRLGGRRS